MKTKLNLLLLLFTIGCVSKQGFSVKDGYWAEVTNDEVNIYSEPSIEGDIKKVLIKGSVVYIGETLNEFTEIYTYDPRNDRDEAYRATYRYYAKNPKLTRTNYRSNSVGAGKIVEPPYDPAKSYIRGERGGCYYINSNGNKTYVLRSYCSGPPIKSTSTRRSSSSYTSTCGARTKSGGYCKRKVKGGGRCYQH